MKKKLLISFSGGRTSAYMTWWLMNEWADRDNWEMIVVFANTGIEREETLRFVEMCDKHFELNVVWVEAIVNPIYRKGKRSNVVNFDKASRKGEPFEAIIAKYGMPNQTAPYCSDYLKAVVIRDYAKQIGWKDYFTAIGIRADEPRRLKWEVAKKENLIYPLATLTRATKSTINSFWMNESFDLELKSYEGNCTLCWKKSKRKLLTILNETPELADWWALMESKYENFIPDSRKQNDNIKPPLRFYRENNSIHDLIEEAKFPFNAAIDESKIITPEQQDLFSWNMDMDSNDGCTESCEVF